MIFGFVTNLLDPIGGGDGKGKGGGKPKGGGKGTGKAAAASWPVVSLDLSADDLAWFPSKQRKQLV